jgi:hypothetical protein
VVEVRPAVQDDDRVALADVAAEQLRSVDRHPRLASLHK